LAHAKVGSVNAKKTVIVYVIGPLPPPYCGHSIMTQHAVEAMRSEGYTVKIFDLASIGRTGRSGVFSVRRFAEVLGLVAKLSACLVAHRPTLVYVTPAQSALGAIRDLVVTTVLTCSGVPYVLHFHGARFRECYESMGPLLERAFRFMLVKARSLIVVAAAFKRQFTDLVSPDRIFLVPNCVAEDIFPLDNELQLKFDTIRDERHKDSLHVLFLSNLTRAKGVFDAIEACRLLISNEINVCFTFAGEWPADHTREGVERLVGNYGLQENVRFAGVVTGQAKRELLQNADVFILPSYNEGLPVSILEAMAWGLPVVTTRVGAIPELITDGENGFLVEPGDIEALVDRLRTLSRSPDLRRSMGIRNSRIARDAYTVESFSKSFLHVIRKTLEL